MHRGGLIVLVVLGGSVGTAGRAGLDAVLSADVGTWPWPTFTVNIVGSFLLGLLVAALARRGAGAVRTDALRVALGAGLLGGFTTYSSFVLESDQLWRDGRPGLAVAYVASSIVLGVLAAAVGTIIGGGARPADVDPDEAPR